MKSKHTKGTQEFLRLFQEKFSGFLLNNDLVYVFPPHSEQNSENRAHLVQDKGHCSCQKWGTKLSFHHEGGGAVNPFAP